MENITKIADLNGPVCQNITNAMCQSLSRPNVLIAKSTLNVSYENLDACNLENSYGYEVFNQTNLETSFFQSQNPQLGPDSSIGGYLISECDIIRNSNFVLTLDKVYF